MKQKIKHILFLGVKELKSFFNDKVFLSFVIWGFTLNIISQTKSIKMDVNNASVATAFSPNEATFTNAGSIVNINVPSFN